MILERRRKRELVPSYSLTGDLLSFLRCGLQYRYLNGSSLPPSRPVQMWFGEFIHGVMESAYRIWLEGFQSFPWPCRPTPFNEDPPDREINDIGEIGDLVESALAVAGKSPRSRLLRNSAYSRAERAVNEIGPQLFPLIRSAEEKVIGTRTLHPPQGVQTRARMYELHGVMDVLSSVAVEAEKDNIICRTVREMVGTIPDGAEIIVDYKGSRRPSSDHSYWKLGDWQLQTYAWLRSRQPGAFPIVAGVLIYINELAPSASAIRDLQRQVRHNVTDVMPESGSQDDYYLRTWRAGSAIPDFTRLFRMRRSIRVVPITQDSMDRATSEFDRVVLDIEASVAKEAQYGTISSHWRACGDEPTCVACDFRHFCPSPAAHRDQDSYVPQAPSAP